MKKLKLNYKAIYFIYCLIIFFSILMRDIFSISINKYIILMIILTALILLNEMYILAFLSFMIPLFQGLPGNYIVMSTLLIIIIKRKKIDKSIFYLPIGIFLTIELLNLYKGHSSIFQYFIFCCYILLISIILLRKNKNYNKYLILISYVYGVICCNILILINTLKYVSFGELIKNNIRVGNIEWVDSNFNSSNIELSLDQNTLGYLTIVGICITLLLLSKKLISLKKGSILIVINIFFGMLTMSRTFFLVLIFLVVYSIIANISSGKIKVSILLIISTLLVTIFIMKFFPQLIEGFIKRFNEVDITGGRSTLFKLYNNVYFSTINIFLFGIGLQNMHVKTGIFGIPHNGIQQIYISSGIIGIVCIILWFCGIIINNKSKKLNFINILPFLCFFIYIQGLQFLSPYILMLPIIPICLSLDV